jgi:hypothetical protein
MFHDEPINQIRFAAEGVTAFMKQFFVQFPGGYKSVISSWGWN